jgi:hypothetical protein
MSRSFAEIARHPARFGVILALAVLALVVALMNTSAATPTGFMEITDGNVRDSGPPDPPYDWANSGLATPNVACPSATPPLIHVSGAGGMYDCGQFINSTTPPIKPSFVCAGAGCSSVIAQAFTVDPLAGDTTPACGRGDPTIYTSVGVEKNGDQLSTETFATGSVPSKDDMGNVYALDVLDTSVGQPAGGTNEIYLGGERVVNSGDSHFDFEFLQKPLTKPVACSGTFTGDRAQGDFLASIDYTKGGTLGGFDLHQWHCLADTDVFVSSTTQAPSATVCNPDTTATAHYQLVNGTSCLASPTGACTPPPACKQTRFFSARTARTLQKVA